MIRAWMSCLLISICLADLDTHFNSQHYVNGTTTVDRTREGSSISMHFNEPQHESVPLLNYTNYFNRLPVAEQREAGVGSKTPSPPRQDDTVVERRICSDDKVELDFLQGKAISLESNLTRMSIDYNFTLTKYDQCKEERRNLEKKLNFTTDSWAACKRFCGGP